MILRTEADNLFQSWKNRMTQNRTHGITNEKIVLGEYKELKKKIERVGISLLFKCDSSRAGSWLAIVDKYMIVFEIANFLKQSMHSVFIIEFL